MIDVNSMYPLIGGLHKIFTNNISGHSPDILSKNTIISKADFNRHVLGIFETDEWEVSKVSEPYMNRYCDDDTRDIHFLFETDNWNGRSIKDMTSSHIINSTLMLLKRANEFKLNYELFVIDHSNDKLLKPITDIDTLASMDASVWIKTTPIFIAFLKELGVRGLLSYFDIVLKRFDTEELKNGDK